MRQWTVDAFADRPFRGNPACVVEPTDAWRDAAWMQALAAENNQAETAFLLKTGDPARFGLRWFTPAVEVPLCGHATLASSHVLFRELGVAAERITFDTLSGPLTVARAGEGYEMDFPAQPPTRIAVPAGLAEALGATPVEVWASTYLMVLLDSADVVRGLSPDLPALAKLGGEASLGPGNIGIAARAGPEDGCDVVARFFAPGSGIPEDPTTGSMYCVLGPLFADRLGRASLSFHQAYPNRGGDVGVTVSGGRVKLAGRAVTVIESVLRL